MGLLGSDSAEGSGVFSCCKVPACAGLVPSPEEVCEWVVRCCVRGGECE